VRKEYIEKQKREHGRKVIGTLPVHYPKELFTAARALVVEIWGPPGTPRGPDAGRVQTYVCPVVRNALAFLAAGGADVVDAMLFPHTCDSIQGLASLAPDLGGWDKPTLRFIHPKGERRQSSARFLRAELQQLLTEITKITGFTPSASDLDDAIILHREIDAKRRHLLEHRRHLPFSDLELYALLRRGEMLWPAEHLEELRAAEAKMTEQPAHSEVPVMITGYVPEPQEIFSTLGEVGAMVVADDYAAVGRRVPRHDVAVSASGLDALVEQTFLQPPCPTRGANESLRIEYLDRLFKQSGAAGLIIHTVKFCEPELFDVPAIRKHFSARNVPVLSLETELEPKLSGQATTRLEAFIEMVKSNARAA